MPTDSATLPGRRTTARTPADDLLDVEQDDIIPDYVTPAAVAQRLNTHVATVIRWIRDGSRLHDGSRLRLRADRLPGGWRTTWEWVDEFIGRLTADRSGQPAGPVAPRTPTARSRAAERADRELAAAGF